jgi:Bacterial alpha-L-rhamnosidase 6 hairpin glycosidase domain/Alpha-L-rhamnosidase N-terminal domain
MIAADNDFDGAPLLRREFTLEEGHGLVTEASLTLSALGVVEARLNGHPVSGDLLTPGWSSYEWRLRYVTLTAVAIGSELERIGTFRTSDPMLNRFHESVVWSLRGNFLDVPTDCPQRDERLGWTGDIAVFAPTAAFLFDVDSFLCDWLRDVALEQAHRGGIIPYVVPDVLKFLEPSGLPAAESTAIWSDAGVWVPWALYQAFAVASPARGISAFRNQK